MGVVLKLLSVLSISIICVVHSTAPLSAEVIRFDEDISEPLSPLQKRDYDNPISRRGTPQETTKEINDFYQDIPAILRSDFETQASEGVVPFQSCELVDQNLSLVPQIIENQGIDGLNLDEFRVLLISKDFYERIYFHLTADAKKNRATGWLDSTSELFIQDRTGYGYEDLYFDFWELDFPAGWLLRADFNTKIPDNCFLEPLAQDTHQNICNLRLRSVLPSEELVEISQSAPRHSRRSPKAVHYEDQGCHMMAMVPEETYDFQGRGYAVVRPEHLTAMGVFVGSSLGGGSDDQPLEPSLSVETESLSTKPGKSSSISSGLNSGSGCSQSHHGGSALALLLASLLIYLSQTTRKDREIPAENR